MSTTITGLTCHTSGLHLEGVLLPTRMSERKSRPFLIMCSDHRGRVPLNAHSTCLDTTMPVFPLVSGEGWALSGKKSMSAFLLIDEHT